MTSNQDCVFNDGDAPLTKVDVVAVALEELTTTTTTIINTTTPETQEMEASFHSDSIVDAFPDKIFDDWTELHQLMTLFTSNETIKLYKADAIPLIPYKIECSDPEDENRVYQRIAFYNLIEDRAMLSDRFDRLYEDASQLRVRTGHENVNWATLDKKLLKLPRVAHRTPRSKTNKTDGLLRKGNADNRQSFVYRNQHLVKKNLTNGIRNTHVFDLYIIFNVPLLMYHQVSGSPLPEASFYASSRRFFESFLLNPIDPKYTIYYVPPGSTYLTISLQKTCYSIIRVTENALRFLNQHYSIYYAFDPVLKFQPKPKNELDQMTSENGHMKRKRGRPTKSLDKMYWYKDSEATTASTTMTTTTLAVTAAVASSDFSTDIISNTTIENVHEAKIDAPILAIEYNHSKKLNSDKVGVEEQQQKELKDDENGSLLKKKRRISTDLFSDSSYSEVPDLAYDFSFSDELPILSSEEINGYLKKDSLSNESKSSKKYIENCEKQQELCVEQDDLDSILNYLEASNYDFSQNDYNYDELCFEPNSTFPSMPIL